MAADVFPIDSRLDHVETRPEGDDVHDDTADEGFELDDLFEVDGDLLDDAPPRPWLSPERGPEEGDT